MFMKHEAEDWIMHVLFGDNMIHASMSNALLDQFISEYQANSGTYIQETLAEYKAYATKSLKQKQVPMQSGIMLEQEDVGNGLRLPIRWAGIDLLLVDFPIYERLLCVRLKSVDWMLGSHK